MNQLKKLGFVLAGLAVLATALPLSATVGGPTYVYNPRFDTKTDALYFTEHSQTGRGCLPVLKKLVVKTGTTETIYPCDGEVFDVALRESEISTRTSNLSYLSPLNLRKNNIQVTVEAGEEEKLGEEWVIKTNMTVSVYQGGKTVEHFSLSGCSAEQPFVIDGYALPNHADKIALLISSKGDCFEGGYIHETLHLISGVQMVDSTGLNVYKGNNALTPHEGSLVVYPGQALGEVSADPVSVDEVKTVNFSTLEIVLSGLLGLLLGAGLARFTQKSR